MPMKKTNIRLDSQAEHAIARIMDRYGLTSISAAIRFALTKVAQETQRENNKTNKQ